MTNLHSEPLPDLYDLWDYGNPAETAVRFRTLLPVAEQSGNVAYTVELLTQIARTQSLQGNFAEAHTILDQAHAMLTPELVIPHLRYLLERGRTFNSSGAVETAVPLFHEAFQAGQSVGPLADFYTVDAAHMLGIATASVAEQLEWNLVALDLARQSADPRTQNWRGSLLNNIGWSYFEAQENEKAVAIFQEALVWNQENRPDKPENIRIARWSVARVLRAMGRVAEALAMQEMLLAEIEAAEAVADGFVFEEIGECLWALGQAEVARPYFAQAYEQLSQVGWLVRTEPERLERLRSKSNWVIE